MNTDRRQQPAFTLIEILIVVAIMGVVAALIIPQMSPSINEQIRSSAYLLVSDLDYARSLAISEGSTYKVEFDASENRYILSNSGTNSDLDTLPSAPFRNPNDPFDQNI
ncbi:MAG: pilus assembly FimT family protein [Pirellulales bacterium]